MAQHTSARASKKSSENDTQSRRQAALDTALAQVEKNFGKGLRHAFRATDRCRMSK
jgi:recombination protein RecA